ncbi:MAG: EAL domain-containing protein [Coprococcus sp.]
MELRWEKAYKPKRKLYILKTVAANGYEEFCEENGYDWYVRFDSIYRPLGPRAFFYMPEKMTEDGCSRLCGGVELGYSDMDKVPMGCESITIPGFDVVDISGFDVDLIEDIAGLMEKAYSYARIFIESEKLHIVSNNKLPYVCYMESTNSLKVEIPVWSKKTKTEEMLTLDNMSKRDLYELAYRDSATGFYNWTWLKAKLEQCEYIGLDRFVFASFDIKGSKLINNIFGRETEKELFRHICDVISKKDWILYAAKCEKDNFAMIMEYMSEEDINNHLFDLFEELGELPSNHKYKVFYSCGIVVYDEDENINTDMRIEDMAVMAQLQCAKSNVTEIKLYTEEMKRIYVMAQQYKVELPDAIENEDLVVYLQPKYNPQNDKLTGAEALIRWFYKGGDILSPQYFVPQFESDGTIDVIDRYVLRQVCRKFAEWKKLDYPLHPISVNLSRHQIARPDLIYILCDIVDEYGVDHSLIDFEITESAEFSDMNYLIGVLNDIKAQGFKISMDDFGTGYSCLSLLKDMPLDIIKIDKSFIDGIAVGEANNKDMLMAKDILTIANHLGIKSLAEGVETFEQKEYLKEWGCHYIQGYYYSKPIPVSDYEKLLAKEKENLIEN